MPELSPIEKADSLKELMLKYNVSALNLASVLGIKSKKTMYLKIADITMFSIADVVVMSNFFNVSFKEMCDLFNRELEIKKTPINS
jgi:hypothetical protein